MKVLEQGKPGSSWSKEYKCTGIGNHNIGCNSKLLVDGSDVYQTASSDYTGGTDYFYTFMCPVCKVETDIPKRDVPSGARLPSKKEFLARQVVG
jgi:hypothetical protein